MALKQEIRQALAASAQWLLSIREHGSWQDMVYKEQGILNTAEAWRSLALLKQVLPHLEWDGKWLEQDIEQMIEEVEQQGFQRSPYAPAGREHESVDSVAFVSLMIQSLSLEGTSPTLRMLSQHAKDWLMEHRSSEGLWSWGKYREGFPLYPYFTYMASKALGEKAPVLKSLQLRDGSFPVHSLSQQPDIASTAYASLALGKCPERKSAIRFLLSAPLHDITQAGLLKIDKPQQAPQLALSYENYAVAGDVLLALVAFQQETSDWVQLQDRMEFLVHYLLEQQEPGKGWPQSYATLYVTHTVIEALVSYLEWMETRKPTTSASQHFNPYIFGFPIQRRDLFFGRESILERVREDMKVTSATKRDLALVGERRIGKTSLLYQLQTMLKEEGHHPLFLDLELIQSVPQFLQSFITQLGQAVFQNSSLWRAYHRLDRGFLRQLDIELQTPMVSLHRLRTQDMVKLFLDDVATLLSRFRKSREHCSRKCVCLLDEIGCLQPELYRLLRGLAQASPDLVFIIAGSQKDCQMLTDTASPLYNIFNVIPVEQLDRQSAIQLITQPVEGRIRYSRDAIELLLDASQRRPYHLQGLCYHALRLLPVSESLITKHQVQSAIKEWEDAIVRK